MTTGYTKIVEEGATLEQYAFECARAFLVHLRDSKADVEEITPDDYYAKKLVTAKEEFENVRKISREDADRLAREEFDEESRRVEESIQRERDMRYKYELMHSQVSKWKPASDELLPLKDFMLKQLEIGKPIEHAEHRVVLLTAEEWISEKANRLLREIKYYSAEIEKETQRCQEINSWIRSLRKSFEKVEL